MTNHLTEPVELVAIAVMFGCAVHRIRTVHSGQAWINKVKARSQAGGQQ